MTSASQDWEKWDDAPLYELFNYLKRELDTTNTEAQTFLNSVCKGKPNGSNKVTVTLKKKDLIPFYKMRQIPFELGGILDISEEGLLRSGIVGGSKKTVHSSQLPDYAVHFHTHPSFPAVPDNIGIFEYTIERYKKKPSKFPIDVMFQSVSNSDISTFSAIVLQNRSQAMLIFTPEGVYVLTPDLAKLRNLQPEQRDIEALQKEGKDILKKRNEIITDDIKKMKAYLLNALGPKSKPRPASQVDEQEIISFLQKTQKNLARKIVEMINQDHSILRVRYYIWTTDKIDIEIYCSRVLADASSFLGLSPHQDY